jgi:hypothetical protein
MANPKITPPAPPDLKGMREAEKVAQASTVQAQPGDEETTEGSSVEDIRGLLHDAVESIATALQQLDELEGQG